MGQLANIAHLQSRIGTGWGFAVVILGILALMAPFVSGATVTLLVAVVMVAAGLSTTIYAFKAGSFGKGVLQFLFGGITIVAGVAMFFTPVFSMLTITGVLMAYFLVDGIFTIISGVKARPAQGWVWILISGVASIVLAVLLFRDWPASGAYAVGLLVGIRLIMTGWSIAMLGIAGDATVDAAEKAIEAG